MRCRERASSRKASEILYNISDGRCKCTITDNCGVMHIYNYLLLPGKYKQNFEERAFRGSVGRENYKTFVLLYSAKAYVIFPIHALLTCATKGLIARNVEVILFIFSGIVVYNDLIYFYKCKYGLTDLDT